MNPQEMQPNNPQDMTPEDAKASLGIATRLQSQLMPQQPIEGSETPETAPEGETKPAMEGDIQEMETRIMDEIKGLKETIEQSTPKDKNQELEDLKKEIEAVLNSDDE